jgi:catechol 2,3-dioxygenase-like lactoylglutathione lyase family enzyme
MVKGVANVWVPVEDIGRALDFYRDTLGFSVIKEDGPWAEIDANGLNPTTSSSTSRQPLEPHGENPEGVLC